MYGPTSSFGHFTLVSWAAEIICLLLSTEIFRIEVCQPKTHRTGSRAKYLILISIVSTGNCFFITALPVARVSSNDQFQ